MRFVCISTIFLLVVYQDVFGKKTLPKVSTPLGEIEGLVRQSVGGREYFSFEGIPFAKPPIGKHRFKEPVSIKPWKGTWKAHKYCYCLTRDHMPVIKVHGDEDCLYLNVYSPKLGTLVQYDVIVYIHGGAFMFGAGGHYQSDYLLDRDVVYVSINYRLGPLGFLSTEDEVVPGNNGIKDQIMALKWVKDNIKYFGGNPNSITLYGTSAGGASTHLHTLIPKSKGLFERAFSQSGSILCNWALMENPLEATTKLAASVGCDFNDSKMIVDCLRKRPARQIVEGVEQFQPWLYNPYSPFAVVVDGEWTSDPVLPQHPYLLLVNKKVASDVPWLTSRTSEEGLYPGGDFYYDNLLEELDSKWDDLAPHILHYNFTVSSKNIKDVNKKIRDFYFGKNKISKDSFNKLIQLMGERLFDVDIEKSTRLQARAIKSPVFHYYFAYRGEYSWTTSMSSTNENIGVSHADDTAYVLKCDGFNIQTTNRDKQMSKIMIDLLLSFAETGVPVVQNKEIPKVPRNLKEGWSCLSIESPSEIFIEKNANVENREFWDSLPFMENEKLFNAKDEL